MAKLQALREATKTDRHHIDDGYWGADEPKCPHCGKVCKVADNEWWKLHEDGDHDVVCPHCDEDFSVSTRVSYSFSTYEQDEVTLAEPPK